MNDKGALFKRSGFIKILFFGLCYILTIYIWVNCINALSQPFGLRGDYDPEDYFINHDVDQALLGIVFVSLIVGLSLLSYKKKKSFFLTIYISIFAVIFFLFVFMTIKMAWIREYLLDDILSHL
jgi:hypothetical protein